MNIDWNKPCKDIKANTQNIVVVANWNTHIDLHLTHKLTAVLTYTHVFFQCFAVLHFL